MDENHVASSEQADIALHGRGDIGNVLTGNEMEEHGVTGFDEEFDDIVEYIINITHKIWDEKAVGSLYRYYRHNAVIHTADGETYGRDAVIANTIQGLAAFPGRRLFGDEVIWAGNDEAGFYTSHRITHVGHNHGASVFGPATGRKVAYRAIADCIVENNQVVEEWLVRDNVSLIRQLGFDEHELAKTFAQREDVHVQPAGEVERVYGQTTPKDLPPQPESFDIEDFVRRSIHEIWNWRLLNKVDDYYVENYQADLASDRRLYGRGDLKAFILSLLAAFPDAALHVDHFCALADGPDAYRAATRWTLLGTHEGRGLYGEPTGNRVRVMGISHHLVRDGKFVQEWTLFDEFALLKQIYTPNSHTEAAPAAEDTTANTDAAPKGGD